ncbi:SDR family oxidoreductase [Amycolatopsis rhizosphaerae]|uniref:SDR family oxidoreductase n=1 Tax=Amycolatopsis rhizosphaerae TaxID=2053003 RepID=A0A558CEJ9_9PSEU|nr:SDR family oxidoreductase [Amycolatopsis rhizosphaerae]TVT47092.1 SDR family oxidoreductase [Amycolatopsis rhizosphaerae]
MDVTGQVRGKVVVITGGARGIGFATARALHRLGASVAIGDVDEIRLKESAKELGIGVHGPLDVTSPESFAAFLDRVERELGPVDVLVNNAGIMPVGVLADEPDEVTRRILDINVFGVITGSKLALRRMLPRGRGHVINIASLAGELLVPGLATYGASKAAVLGFTEAARLEHRGTGVVFSAVLPTFTNTELSSGTTGNKVVRNAEPEEIARAVVELIAAPRPRVRVTRLAGALVAGQKFVPRRIGDFLVRATGMATAFTTRVDNEQRRAYEARARGADDAD